MRLSRGLTYNSIILVLSVLIPVVVGILLFMPEKLVLQGNWNLLLPHVNGIINTITALLLVFGFIMIRNGNIVMHRNTMITAFLLGALFLVSYLVYHSTSESTMYGDIDGNGILDDQETAQAGLMRIIYLIVLLSHILLAIVVVPFVLFAFYYALTGRFDKHKRTVRFTLPIWLYVSVSGVVVYLMIRPFY